MSTSLTIHQDRTVTPTLWSMIADIAPVIFKSRLFMKSANSVEATQAVMLKAHELGLPFTAGFDFIQVIEGKLELSPRGAMALLQNSPLIAEMKVTRIERGGAYVGHECYIKRTNGFEHTVKYTLEDGKKAGLVKPNSNWEKYPENMCQWRAIGFCADVVAPDVTAGMTGLMKMPEHYGVALDEGGNVVDGEAQVVTTPTPPPLVPSSGAVSMPSTHPPVDNEEKWFGPAPETKKLTLADLVEKYGAEAIMVANGGMIPGTDTEVSAVAAKLAAS